MNDLRDRLANLPTERQSYTLQALPSHLAKAKHIERLSCLLTNFDFIEAKVRLIDPWLLINDYEEGFRVGCNDKSLSLIQEALQLSVHILIKDPNQIAGQLIGRLLPYYSFSSKSLIDQAIEWKSTPWLRPLTPLPIMPGGTLHYTLTGHTGAVLSIAVTPDGNFAISGGADETLRVWDLKRWKMSDSLNLPAGIGNKMSGPFYGAIALGGLQAPLSFQGEISAPTSMAVTPDGRYAIFSVFKDRTVWMWDIQKNRLTHIMKGHTSLVYRVAVTPDAKHAVSGGIDGMLLVWNLHQGDERELHPVHIFTEHNDMVSAVEITKDGRYAVSGSLDKTIRVWDIENRKLVRTIYTGRPVLDLAVAHDTHRIISTSTDKAVYVWDINQGVSWLKGICRRGMLNTLKGHKGPIEALAVTPDGRKMISASKDGTLKIWDLERGKFLFNLAKNLFERTTKIVVMPDGRYALTASVDQTIRVWNLNSLADVPYSFDHASAVRAVAITPDGHLAISGSLDNLVKVWDLEERKMLHNLAGHTDVVMTVAVTPDGKYAVSGSGDNTIKVWDLKQGEEIHNLTGHNDKVNSVGVTRDGKYAVSVSGDNTVRLWDLNKGELLATYTDHAEVGALAMTMDGNRALTASADGSLRIWDLVLEKRDRKIISLYMLIQEILGENEEGISLEELLNPEKLLNRTMSHILAEHIELINTIAVTNEGSLAVSGGMNGSLRVWDLDEMKEIRTLGSGSKAVWSVSITPEGRPLLLTTEGQSLKIWDMEEWAVIASFTGDSDFLSCAVARDGVAIVAGDTMGKVHILRLEERNGVK